MLESGEEEAYFLFDWPAGRKRFSSLELAEFPLQRTVSGGDGWWECVVLVNTLLRTLLAD